MTPETESERERETEERMSGFVWAAAQMAVSRRLAFSENPPMGKMVYVGGSAALVNTMQLEPSNAFPA